MAGPQRTPPQAVSGPAPPPRITWGWVGAGLGVAYTLPAAFVALSDPARGIALAIGVLPAAITGLAPRRRERLMVVALGALTGISMFVGGALAQVPVLAVIGIATLAIGSVALTRHTPIGQTAMFLSLPMVGIGLSYDDLGEAAALGALMIAGSIYACSVSLLWPQRPAAPDPPPAEPPSLGYGVRLGAAGASAAALGFLLDLEHVGWATAAALLVMRPVAEMQRLRSAGRVVAVMLGALSAILLLRPEPANVAFSLAIPLAIAGAAATRRSRWYVTPAFTTFLVFLLVLHGHPDEMAARFNERMSETVLGVGLAYFFGLLVPRITATISRSETRAQ